MHDTASATAVTLNLSTALLLFSQVLVGDTATSCATSKSHVFMRFILDALVTFTCSLAVIGRISTQDNTFNSASVTPDSESSALDSCDATFARSVILD